MSSRSILLAAALLGILSKKDQVAVKTWWRRAVPIVLSAFVLPGLGQVYLKHYVRGAIQAGLFLGIVLYITVRVMQDAMAVFPSSSAFSPYFADLLQTCASSFGRFSSSLLPILAVVWGYSLADTVRLAWRWEPERQERDQE